MGGNAPWRLNLSAAIGLDLLQQWSVSMWVASVALLHLVAIGVGYHVLPLAVFAPPWAILATALAHALNIGVLLASAVNVLASCKVPVYQRRTHRNRALRLAMNLFSVWLLLWLLSVLGRWAWSPLPASLVQRRYCLVDPLTQSATGLVSTRPAVQRKIVLVSSHSQKEPSEASRAAFHNFQLYCLRHGCTFVEGHEWYRKHGYNAQAVDWQELPVDGCIAAAPGVLQNDMQGNMSKIKLLAAVMAEYLQKRPEPGWETWVVWMDVDAIILNHAVSMERLIESAVRTAPSVACDQDDGTERSRDVDLIIGARVYDAYLEPKYSTVTNSGVFFLRVSDWSCQFLREIWQDARFPRDQARIQLRLGSGGLPSRVLLDLTQAAQHGTAPTSSCWADATFGCRPVTDTTSLQTVTARQVLTTPVLRSSSGVMYGRSTVNCTAIPLRKFRVFSTCNINNLSFSWNWWEDRVRDGDFVSHGAGDRWRDQRSVVMAQYSMRKALKELAVIDRKSYDAVVTPHSVYSDIVAGPAGLPWWTFFW